ncbi:hydantoinase/oxoprolinase family protein [Brevibacterium luteolum]|uniref:hydantoinase/oxoprolinase family protein n=1 Tax=Brevibacterium luteolum TaxID=199591 RepID=UPI003B67F85B
MYIGIECGGTFTDLVVCDDGGNLLQTGKVLSTPDDPSRAVSNALDLIEDSLLVGAWLFHGSTVATNALIERSGPRLALISSKGFRDIVFIQRQDRERMFDLKYERPKHLLMRDDSYEILERTTADGEVSVGVDTEQVRSVVREIESKGINDIAVSLIHSYANPENERLVRDIIAEVSPGMQISLSSDIAPEFREYERASTTIVSAFLKDRVGGYLNRLLEQATDRGIQRVEIMQSNGGRVPVESAIRNPLGMLRSGPAAGVAGAMNTASRLNLGTFVTLDMGGTSTDVTLVRDSQVTEVNEIKTDGIPVKTPMVDIVAVGAGGGSIAAMDSGGLLTVGPASAGAEPGPVAYGRGGASPTVTDASVVRGILRSDKPISGGLSFNSSAARNALDILGERLGAPGGELALQISKLASTHMAGAIRVATVEKGFNVDGHTLIVYGGAGPMHAAEVADVLGLRDVVVPPHNGLTSAYGLLTAKFRRYYSQTVMLTLNASSIKEVEKTVSTMEHEARRGLAAEGVPTAGLASKLSLDMRYAGQGYELSVRLDDIDLTSEAVRKTFVESHLERFGYDNTEADIQIVTVRLSMEGPAITDASPTIEIDESTPEISGRVLDSSGELDCAFVKRNALPIGWGRTGPCVIEDETSTTFVPTSWSVNVDKFYNLILRKEV